VEPAAAALPFDLWDSVLSGSLERNSQEARLRSHGYQNAHLQKN